VKLQRSLTTFANPSEPLGRAFVPTLSIETFRACFFIFHLLRARDARELRVDHDAYSNTTHCFLLHRRHLANSGIKQRFTSLVISTFQSRILTYTVHQPRAYLSTQTDHARLRPNLTISWIGFSLSPQSQPSSKHRSWRTITPPPSYPPSITPLTPSELAWTPGQR
jgi:hypothetical protein